jgi:glycosyltransferase involved in cell wall biosynthesis
VFAPIIESNQSNLAYRSAARVGQVHRKIFTIQGEYAKHGHASNLVVVRSRHEHDRVVQGLGISAAKVEIVLNGVSPPEPVDTEAIRQQFQLPDQFVLHISQITLARKNVAAMIEAIGPTGLPLIIAGSYGVKAEFDRLMQIANRYKNIRYIGPVKSPVRNALYAACRVFCLPSLHEGTGLVSLEAASYGARVVATRLGGPLDYLLDLVDYCSDPSPAAIRTAVLKAWERPDAEALRQHVTENLTWQNSAYQLLRAYDKHRVSK